MSVARSSDPQTVTMSFIFLFPTLLCLYAIVRWLIHAVLGFNIMSTTTRDNFTQIVLPDLVAHCTFPLRLNPFCEIVTAQSEAWMIGLANFTDKRCRAFRGLKAGPLTAMCYPDCGEEELRVISDFMNYLFNLDDWTDEFDYNSTKRISDDIMNVLYHPNTYKANSTPGMLAKR
jgi:hypothetical protein